MNYYKTAIDILSKDQDWKEICVNIAKSHPKYFVEAAGFIDWRHEARILYIEKGEKIAAMKYCRVMTGMSLPEAKTAVEALE